MCESPVFVTVDNPGITNTINGESKTCAGRNMNKSIFIIEELSLVFLFTSLHPDNFLFPSFVSEDI